FTACPARGYPAGPPLPPQPSVPLRVSRHAAQAPAAANGRPVANTQVEASCAVATPGAAPKPAALAAAPAIAAPTAPPVWRTAMNADAPVARSAPDSMPSRRRFIRLDDRPKPTPITAADSTTADSGASRRVCSSAGPY